MAELMYWIFEDIYKGGEKYMYDKHVPEALENTNIVTVGD